MSRDQQMIKNATIITLDKRLIYYFETYLQLQKDHNQLLDLVKSLQIEGPCSVLVAVARFSSDYFQIQRFFGFNLSAAQFFNKNYICMAQRGLRLAVITIMVILCLGAEAAPISVDFSAFEATFSQDQRLRLTLKCTGGSGVFQFEFKNIPSDWKTVGNSIIIQNFSTSIRQTWRFDLFVTDSFDNYLQQTLMLNFMGTYIGLTAVTLANTGQNSGSYNNFYNPFASSEQLQQKNQNSNSGNVDQTRVSNLVSNYPGIDPLSKLTTGFGIPDTPLTAEVISSARAVYSPERDSNSPYKAQKAAALNRLSNINQTLTNLFDMRTKLVSSINKLKDEAYAAESSANDSRSAVNDCDKVAISLQDTKAKVSNAINDKQSKLSQYNLQIEKINKQLQDEADKLTNLQNMKRKAELDSMPNSKALENLQKTADECKRNLTFSSKQSDQGKVDSQKIKTSIIMLNIETNEAKAKLNQTNNDLSSVRDKIASLQSQLSQAKQYQTNILTDKLKYTNVQIQNGNKIATLEAQLKNVSTQLAVGDCKAYESPIYTIQSLISRDKDNYNGILRQIEDQKQVIEKIKANIIDLKKVTSGLPLEIDTLRKQLSTYDDSINRTSYLCSDAISQYSKAAVSLQMMNDKVDSAQTELDRLNSQVASAQTEQSSAVNALNIITRNQMAYLSAPASASPVQSASPQQNLPQYQIPNSTGNKVISGNSPTVPASSSSSSNKSNPNISIDEIINNMLNQRNKVSAVGQMSQTPSPAPTQFTIQNYLSTQNNPNNPAVNTNTPVITNSPIAASSKGTTGGQTLVSDLGNEFKVSSVSGFKSVFVSDSRTFLRKLGIDISAAFPSQTSYLYTFDDSSLKSLTTRGGSQARLPLLSCTDPSLTDSALVQDVGLGYILAKNNSYLYRLSLSECTKLASTGTSSSLQVGTRIYFSGIPVVSLPNNILLNAYLIVSIPA